MTVESEKKAKEVGNENEEGTLKEGKENDEGKDEQVPVASDIVEYEMETVEVKADSVKDNKISEKPAQTVDSQETEIPTQSKQPETEKPIEDKTTSTWPLESEKPTVVLTEKQYEAEVHVESGKLVVAEELNQTEKLLKVEVQTQTNPPEENLSKVDASDGSKEDINPNPS
ncbi:uncharacterized protein LOC131074024 [Cryptomeria japonica]|uniref:uncharacterized protein LOC131074024 n=1 Tax=Cryptomeria japonica TaxID=3369 RepID=UPI0025ABA761|nr:uncharacterized protein LOC131074024 [Cryptomeria japonica]